MNKDILTPNDYEEIARLLSGEMDEREEKSFRKHIMSDPEKFMAFEQMEKNWNSISFKNEDFDIDTETAWQNLDNRISENTSKSIFFKAPQMLKWAAGWLLLIAIGFSAWYFYTQSITQEPLHILATADDDITHVHTLHDGSVVYLAKNTSLSFPQAFEPTKRFVNLEGEAFFDILHNPEQPFVVETNTATIEVLGTSFNIRTISSNKMELFVETGKVKVILKDNTQNYIKVNQGELLTIVNNEMLKTIAPEQYNTAWRRHHMHFKDEKLINIVKVLNQNYPVVFDINDEQLYERKLTVTFYKDSAESIAKLICLALNIEFEQTTDSNIIFSSGF